MKKVVLILTLTIVSCNWKVSNKSVGNDSLKPTIDSVKCDSSKHITDSVSVISAP